MKKVLRKFFPNSILHFYRKYLKKFHGNELLDKKMLKYINYKNGFYIEMGAHDGLINSNTYYFEKKLNWKGILVEPSNYFYDLKNNRSKKNTFYKTLCIPFNFKKKISLEEVGPYSMARELISDKFLKRQKLKIKSIKNNYSKKKLSFPALKTLNELLKKSKAPKLIDFFSLDVEGSELSVLKGVNFNQFNFKYLLIEITDVDKGKYVKKISTFLKKKNYILRANFTSYDYLFKFTK